MPADDLILSVRQVAQYPKQAAVSPSDLILIQQGGLGGPYASVSAAALVSTALATQGGALFAASVQAGVGDFSVLNAGTLTASNGTIGSLSGLAADFGALTINRQAAATVDYVDMSIGAVRASSVWSFNGRLGDIMLNLGDIRAAGGAPIVSPIFQGMPLAPTPSADSNNEQVATTAFVQRNSVLYINNLLQTHPFVFTFNGRSGEVVLTAQDIIDAGGSGEIFDSPTFTGIPTAPTAPPGTNTTQIATTAFVQQAIAGGPFAPLDSPMFTGYPSGPTAPPGSSTGQLATTAFVMNAVADSVAGVATFNGRSGNVLLEAADITGAGGALLASPALTGVPTAPTAPFNSNSTQIATTAFVMNELAGLTGGVSSFNTRTGAVTLTSADLSAAGGALLASPAFTGVPTAPTAAFGNSSTQIATTAFVEAAILNGAVESFNGRTGVVTLTSADISAAGGAALQSPAFLGTPTAPTAAPGSNSTQLATTAFVTAAIGAGAGVTSFNTRTGAVVLTIGDVTAVGGAPLNSPAFSGTPTSPTAAFGNSSQQIATTAFVANAVAGGVGVSSFNTRSGAVTLLGTDITGAGGALLASPAFTGSPTAPTATAGNSSTQLATTAFVQGAIVAGAVASFNGRVGAVTLGSADLSAAGGALLASPAFTGVPTAPTATLGTNTTQIATTAFVEAALGTAGGVNSFNGRAGEVTLTNADVIGVLPGSTTAPLMDGTAAAGTGAAWARADHVHPTDTTRFSTGGGALTGGVTAPAFSVNAAAGTYRAVNFTTANSMRWAVAADNTAESGSNAGTNFSINRYGDTGAGLGAALSINRANGAVTMPGVVTAAGVLCGSLGITYSGIGGGNMVGFTWASPLVNVFVDNVAQGNIVTGRTGSGLTAVYAFSVAGGSSLAQATYPGGNFTWPITFSDPALKGDVIPAAKDALAAIMSLKVWEYDYLSPFPGAEPQHWDWGLMADAELGAILPPAFIPATSAPDNQTFAQIRELPLVAALVRAVQQLADRIATLEARFAT